MSLLLDTHIVLWGIAADLWEITIKQTAGKLGGPSDLAERVRDMGFRELPVTHAHAMVAGRLPVLHRDLRRGALNRSFPG